MVACVHSCLMTGTFSYSSASSGCRNLTGYKIELQWLETVAGESFLTKKKKKFNGLQSVIIWVFAMEKIILNFSTRTVLTLSSIKRFQLEQWEIILFVAPHFVLMYNRVICFLEKFSILCNNQFGFRSKHSTTQALLYLTDKIPRSIDKGLYCIVLYCSGILPQGSVLGPKQEPGWCPPGPCAVKNFKRYWSTI